MINLATNDSNIDEKLHNITFHLSDAFGTLRTLRLAGGVNIMSSLRRLLRYKDFFGIKTVSVSSKIIENVFADVTLMEKTMKSKSQIKKLGEYSKRPYTPALV